MISCGHCFFQKPTKLSSGFLPLYSRAAILTTISLVFGRIDVLIKSFWFLLTFSVFSSLIIDIRLHEVEWLLFNYASGPQYIRTVSSWGLLSALPIQFKQVYEPFGQSNMHSALDFCPRLASRKTDVQKD